MKPSQVLRGGGPVLALQADTYSHEVTDPADATATFTMANTGVATGGPVFLLSGTYYWLLNGVAADYEVFVTNVSGTPTSGTVGSWVALNTNPVWTVVRTSAGTKVWTANFKIRRVSDTVEMVPNTLLSFSAFVDV